MSYIHISMSYIFNIVARLVLLKYVRHHPSQLANGSTPLKVKSQGAPGPTRSPMTWPRLPL